MHLINVINNCVWNKYDWLSKSAVIEPAHLIRQPPVDLTST